MTLSNEIETTSKAQKLITKLHLQLISLLLTTTNMNSYWIKQILIDNPIARDDDNHLIGLVEIEYMNKNKTFLQPKNYASIIRVRAYLQQHFPELRGSKYEARQKYYRIIKEKIRNQEKPEFDTKSKFLGNTNIPNLNYKPTILEKIKTFLLWK